MSHIDVAPSLVTCESISRWRAMYSDEGALLANPGRHHKALLSNAHELHRNGLIDADKLSDFLELADGALAYAIESLHGGDDDWL